MAAIAHLQPGQRLVCYHRIDDADQMHVRSYDLATACIFDNRTKMVTRIYDHKAEITTPFVHLELTDYEEASLMREANKIAALR